MRRFFPQEKTVHPRLRGELLSTVFLRVSTVHPRLRGELARLNASKVVGSGSSPLTRGTQGDRIMYDKELRFIPAYAGNSLLLFVLTVCRPVHPRLRGELSAKLATIST